MLSNRHTQLLTAYVDGVLSARRRKTVLKLLRKVPEARQMLKELEDTAERLRRLPRVQPAPGFTAEVLQTIRVGRPDTSAAQPAHPSAPLSLPRRLPHWVGAAAAAAILAAITFGSYSFFSDLGRKTPEQDTGQIAKDQNPKDQNDPTKDQKQPAPPLEKTEPHGLVNSLIAGTHDGFNKIAAVRFTGPELSKPVGQARLTNELTKELSKGAAVHVQLAMREPGKTGKRLLNALAASKVKVFVDAEAKRRLDSGSGDYIVYAENVRPDDLTAIIRELSRGGQAASVQNVQVSKLSDGHRRELGRMLGVDAKQFPPPPMDLHNLIETPDVKETPKGKKDKGATEPNPITPSASQEPVALVMVLAPGGNARSAQAREFLAGRASMRPGTLQVVLVVQTSV